MAYTSRFHSDDHFSMVNRQKENESFEPLGVPTGILAFLCNP